MRSDGIPVEALAEVDSTNAEAMRRIAAGERGPRWLRADVQTAGRGRAGRPWSTQRGNFAGSLILPLHCPPAQAHQLSLVAGVALADALQAAAPTLVPRLRLKWPNDVLVDGAKISGILIESTTTAEGLVAVLGMGVNLAHAPDDLQRAVTSLAAQGVSITSSEFLDVLSPALVRTCALWRDGADFAVVRAEWLARALPAGTAMSVNAGGRVVVGRFHDIDADGALRLSLDDGTIATFTFGDVAVG